MQKAFRSKMCRKLMRNFPTENQRNINEKRNKNIEARGAKRRKVQKSINFNSF
jgi:hypothetical protein